MSDEDQRVTQLAEKLARIIHKSDLDPAQEPYVFNAEEVAALKRLVRFIEWLDQMSATGSVLWLVAKFLGAALALALLFAANWERVRGWFAG